MEFVNIVQWVASIGGLGGLWAGLKYGHNYLKNQQKEIEVLKRQVNSILSADLVFNGFPFPMYEKDTDGTYRRVNPKFRASFLFPHGLDEDDIINKTDKEVWDDLTNKILADKSLETLTSGGSYCEWTMEFALKNGKKIGTWHVTKSILQNGNEMSLLAFLKKTG